MSTPAPTPVPPPTMKAAIRTGWTGYTLDFSEDVTTPTLPNHPDKILLKVHAAALNPVDYKLPKLILGQVYAMDMCGTIVALPPDCTNPELKLGDVVVGPVTIVFSGALAEYAIGYASKVAKLPPHWTVEEGAAMPIACGTAMEGFQQAGMIPRGEMVTIPPDDKPPIGTLLVVGSSGGCGILALQLAKGMGIPRIIGICSRKNAELCQANGATEIVPYDEPGEMEAFLKDNVGKVDVIYDTASYSGGTGEEYCDNPKIMALLKNERTTASYIMLNGSKTAKVKAVTLGMGLGYKLQQSLIVLPKFHASGLALGMKLLDNAKLKPITDTSHDFTKDGVQKAYAKLKSRRAKGKIVISISKPEGS